MAKRGINKVILVGNIGKDPDVRNMPNGNTVASLTLATSESWVDKNSGEKREETEWHQLATFGKLAEICGTYLKKGSKVYIEGKLKTKKWQDNEGNDRYTTNIIFDEMQMLDSRANPGQAAQGVQQAEPQPATAGGGNYEDDIPF